MEGQIKHFTDLEAWKVSHVLVLIIYKITNEFPREEKFGLISQLRRAASSITANIAEGWGRYYFADKVRFYYQARGSNCEVQNFIILARELKYIAPESYLELKNKTTESFQLINGLIRSIQRQR